ncbi:MAG TPA: hypothetical protein DDY17_08815 [Syntrophaceae bacterium]|jgi:hypothetical protein|nr:hypothetical protein [Syntrophaceae bacterium]
MKKHTFIALCIGSVLPMFTFFSPVLTHAEVNVSVQVGLPPLVIPAPPGLVVIPNTYVYYPPDQNMDIFFYHGYWYRPHHGYWYRARHYNGPWGHIVSNRVPRAVIAVPPGFRHGPMHERVPYGQVKKNWRGWERDRHWDRDRHDNRRNFHESKHRGPDRDGHKGKHKDKHKGKHKDEHKGR